MIFARKWRQWRQEQEWNARRLCSAMGTSTGYWSKVESGKKPPPSDDLIRRACEVMGSPDRVGYWLVIAQWDRAERTLVNPSPMVKRFVAGMAEWQAVGHTPTAEDLAKLGG